FRYTVEQDSSHSSRSSLADFGLANSVRIVRHLPSSSGWRTVGRADPSASYGDCRVMGVIVSVERVSVACSERRFESTCCSLISGAVWRVFASRTGRYSCVFVIDPFGGEGIGVSVIPRWLEWNRLHPSIRFWMLLYFILLI